LGIFKPSTTFGVFKIIFVLVLKQNSKLYLYARIISSSPLRAGIVLLKIINEEILGNIERKWMERKEKKRKEKKRKEKKRKEKKRKEKSYQVPAGEKRNTFLRVHCTY
jgi:hypothetical protein